MLCTHLPVWIFLVQFNDNLFQVILTLISTEFLLLLLLSHVSHVRLCVTPETAAYKAPPSLGFSRQEHWSGLPFPSPMHGGEKWKWSHCHVWLSDPMDCSAPGSSVHGIFQARGLAWGAITFSGASLYSWSFLSGRDINHPLSLLSHSPLQ